MLDRMNKDPDRHFDKPGSHSNYRQFNLLYNVWKSIKENRDLKQNLHNNNQRPGDDDLFEVAMRISNGKDIRNFNKTEEDKDIDAK
jgi:hypothetical protein